MAPPVRHGEGRRDGAADTLIRRPRRAGDIGDSTSPDDPLSKRGRAPHQPCGGRHIRSCRTPPALRAPHSALTSAVSTGIAVGPQGPRGLPARPSGARGVGWSADSRTLRGRGHQCPVGVPGHQDIAVRDGRLIIARAPHSGPSPVRRNPRIPPVGSNVGSLNGSWTGAPGYLLGSVIRHG